MSRRLSPCEEGEDAGIQLVDNFYQNDCSYVLTSSFRDDVEAAANLQFQCTGFCNYKDKAFNDCALTAVDQELDRIGLECIEDQGVDDCNELGEEAATKLLSKRVVYAQRALYFGGHQLRISKLFAVK